MVFNPVLSVNILLAIRLNTIVEKSNKLTLCSSADCIIDKIVTNENRKDKMIYIMVLVYFITRKYEKI